LSRHDELVSGNSYLAVLKLRVRDARIALDLRQEDAAEAANMQLRSYQRFESPNDKKEFNPSIMTIRAVAQAVGLTMCALTQEPSPSELERVGQPLERKRILRPRA
jgi:transcriptional regulator with XRE-family HTH domain